MFARAIIRATSGNTGQIHSFTNIHKSSPFVNFNRPLTFVQLKIAARKKKSFMDDSLPKYSKKIYSSRSKKIEHFPMHLKEMLIQRHSRSNKNALSQKIVDSLMILMGKKCPLQASKLLELCDSPIEPMLYFYFVEAMNKGNFTHVQFKEFVQRNKPANDFTFAVLYFTGNLKLKPFEISDSLKPLLTRCFLMPCHIKEIVNVIGEEESAKYIKENMGGFDMKNVPEIVNCYYKDLRYSKIAFEISSYLTQPLSDGNCRKFSYFKDGNPADSVDDLVQNYDPEMLKFHQKIYTLVLNEINCNKTLEYVNFLDAPTKEALAGICSDFLLLGNTIITFNVPAFRIAVKDLLHQYIAEKTGISNAIFDVHQIYCDLLKKDKFKTTSQSYLWKVILAERHFISHIPCFPTLSEKALETFVSLLQSMIFTIWNSEMKVDVYHFGQNFRSRIYRYISILYKQKYLFKKVHMQPLPYTSVFVGGSPIVPSYICKDRDVDTEDAWFNDSQSGKLISVFDAVSCNANVQWEINSTLLSKIEEFMCAHPSHHLSTKRRLNDIKLLAGKKFYNPNYIDFRGRIYPRCVNFSLNGDDLIRSLYQFAVKKPLTSLDQYNAIKLHMYSLAEFDRYLSITERISFIDANMSVVLSTASDPNKDLWWTRNTNPFEVLAACIELREIYFNENYASGLPIQKDGTSNMFQHIAAFMKDENLAREVNMIDCERPQDIYTTILNSTINILRQKIGPYEYQKIVYGGLLDRKVIKELMFSIVYGGYGAYSAGKLAESISTQMGIKHLKVPIADALVLACEPLLAPVDKFKEWFGNGLSQVANRLITPYIYSPLGLRVSLDYVYETAKFEDNNIITNVVPNTRKVRSAGFANFIHLLDGTHMMLTSIDMNSKGLVFSSIHDGFMTHARDVDALDKSLREQFVKMYNQPILDNLYNDLKQAMCYKNKVPMIINPPPLPGNFELSQVLDSRFFFH